VVFIVVFIRNTSEDYITDDDNALQTCQDSDLFLNTNKDWCSQADIKKQHVHWLISTNCATT